MQDSAFLQLLGQASTTGIHAAFVYSGTGLTLVSSAGAGVFVATCDKGLLGDNASVAQCRVVCTPVGGAPNSNAQVAKSVVAGQLTITVTMCVGAVATDSIGFDLFVYSDPSN